MNVYSVTVGVHMITGNAVVSVQLQRFHFSAYHISQAKQVWANAPNLELICSFY